MHKFEKSGSDDRNVPNVYKSYTRPALETLEARGSCIFILPITFEWIFHSNVFFKDSITLTSLFGERNFSRSKEQIQYLIIFKI